VTTGAGTIIAAGATTILSLSFVFSVTAQEVLGSCIFLFVKHPFDVGDRVEIIQNGSLNGLFVEEISLLYTVFRNVVDHRITQVPNVILNSNWIDNITRSKAMKERVTLAVDFGTTFADIQLLKAEMEDFVGDKDNSRDFLPDVEVEVFGVGNMDKLELRLEVHHKSNWSNEAVRAARRSKIMCALVLAIRKIPIYGPAGPDAALGDTSNPSYSVAISYEQAKKHQEKASEAKEAKRMIPTANMPELTSLVQAKGGVSTGIDSTFSSATALYRGPSISSKNGARPIDRSTTPVIDNPGRESVNEIYRVPSATSQLAVRRSNENDRAALLRTPSTGRRKESNSASPAVAPSLAAGAALNAPLPPTPSQPVRYEDHSGSASPVGSQNGLYNSNNPFIGSLPPQQPRPHPSSSSPISTPMQSHPQPVPRRTPPGES
jgi:Mechanosensitive ion channel